MKKVILIITIISLMVVSLGVKIFAGEEISNTESKLNQIPPVTQSSCTVIEHEKEGTRIPADVSKNIKLMRKPPDIQYGERYESYGRTEYTFKYYSINAENVGPRFSEKQIGSVARGATSSTTLNLTLSGTVSYSGSCGIDLEKIINLGVTGSVSGTVTGSWTGTRTFVGPPEGSKFSSRKYYAAMNYDKCTAVTTAIDYYDTHDYNNGRDMIVQYNSSSGSPYTKYIYNIKVPTRYEYSVDVN